MSFDTKSACHENVSDYQECLEGAFNVGAAGIDTANDYQILILSLTVTLVIMACGWMTMSIYNSWVSGSFNFNELISRIIRVLIILSILAFLLVG
jgi:integrating conjugative element protein (TIGR03758 family)